MNDEYQEIKIVSIDKAAIAMRPGSQIWDIPFKLSVKPDQDWETNFYKIQQKDKNVMKRKMKFIKDVIAVEVFETDDLQKVLDVIKREVEETNVLCEADYQTKLKIRRDLVALHQKEGDVTNKFKEVSDKLNF